MLRRRLTIEEAATEINGCRIVWGTPKSHERRSVPIPRSIVNELGLALASKARHDLAFSSPMGGVLCNRNARAIWFDTAVQRMLGHSSAAMTLDRYTDLFDDELDAVADRLNAVRDHTRGLSADFCGPAAS